VQRIPLAPITGSLADATTLARRGDQRQHLAVAQSLVLELRQQPQPLDLAYQIFQPARGPGDEDPPTFADYEERPAVAQIAGLIVIDIEQRPDLTVIGQSLFQRIAVVEKRVRNDLRFT